jgi:hypothetical protein
MFLRNICLLMFAAIHISSCKKDGFGPLTDNRPDIPVTVANVFDYRPQPTVKASKTENKITIVLQIPATTGRTIKEITKSAASTNYTAVQGTTVGPTGLYSNTPVPGSGVTVTFTTTFDEYKTKTNTTTNPSSNALLARNFYFVLTLDNGEVIIPTPVRVWIVD